MIHRADLQPLDNLELFGMSPLYTLESYRAMGRNAAGYALGHRVGPVPTELDNFARAKLIVRTTLLHAQEARAVVAERPRSSWPFGATGRTPEDRRRGQPTAPEQCADPVGRGTRPRRGAGGPGGARSSRQQRDRADPEEPCRGDRECQADRAFPERNVKG